MKYVIPEAAKSWRPSVSVTIGILSLSGQKLSSSELEWKLWPPDKNLETICHPTSFRVAPWPGFPCLSSVLSHPFDLSAALWETGSSSQQTLGWKCGLVPVLAPQGFDWCRQKPTLNIICHIIFPLLWRCNVLCTFPKSRKGNEAKQQHQNRH